MIFRLEDDSPTLIGENILGGEDHFKYSAFNFEYDVMLIKEL